MRVFVCEKTNEHLRALPQEGTVVLRSTQTHLLVANKDNPNPMPHHPGKDKADSTRWSAVLFQKWVEGSLRPTLFQ
jgi:hypothetical protein